MPFAVLLATAVPFGGLSDLAAAVAPLPSGALPPFISASRLQPVVVHTVLSPAAAPFLPQPPFVPGRALPQMRSPVA